MIFVLLGAQKMNSSAQRRFRGVLKCGVRTVLSHGIETRRAFEFAILDEQTCFAKGVPFPATRLLDTLAVSRWSESMGSSLGCRGDLAGAPGLGLFWRVARSLGWKGSILPRG